MGSTMLDLGYVMDVLLESLLYQFVYDFVAVQVAHRQVRDNWPHLIDQGNVLLLYLLQVRLRRHLSVRVLQQLQVPLLNSDFVCHCSHTVRVFEDQVVFVLSPGLLAEKFKKVMQDVASRHLPQVLGGSSEDDHGILD